MWTQCPAPWSLYEVNTDGVLRPINSDTTIKIWKNHNGYICCNLWNDNVKRVQPGVYLHRLMALTFLSDAFRFEIDHINHDKSDNRLENLRCVTHSQNLKNRRPFKWSQAAKTRAYLRNFNGPAFEKKLMMIKL